MLLANQISEFSNQLISKSNWFNQRDFLHAKPKEDKNLHENV